MTGALRGALRGVGQAWVIFGKFVKDLYQKIHVLGTTHPMIANAASPALEPVKTINPPSDLTTSIYTQIKSCQNGTTGNHVVRISHVAKGGFINFWGGFIV